MSQPVPPQPVTSSYTYETTVVEPPRPVETPPPVTQSTSTPSYARKYQRKKAGDHYLKGVGGSPDKPMATRKSTTKSPMRQSPTKGVQPASLSSVRNTNSSIITASGAKPYYAPPKAAAP
mmetsp:Transcript_32954/g.50404  ORF Transcript_32954/g.50404 Transcript_32954/m.50404 type:complete len:120 (-) Transcript_32954:503-862(-)